MTKVIFLLWLFCNGCAGALPAPGAGDLDLATTREGWEVNEQLERFRNHPAFTGLPEQEFHMVIDRAGTDLVRVLYLAPGGVMDPAMVIEVDWLDGSDTLSTIAAEWWVITHTREAVSCFQMFGPVALDSRFIKSASGFDLIICRFDVPPSGRIVRARNGRKEQ